MKKLSELHQDTMLVVNQDRYGEAIVLDKASFLLTSEYIDRNKMEQLDVFLAEEECATFSFEKAINNIAEDMFEGWKEQVEWYMNKACLDLERIESQINEAFSKCPAFCCGEIVDVEN